MAQREYKGIRIFENPFLERFTRVHPATPFIVWIPIVGFLLYQSIFVHSLGVMEWAILPISAIFFWTFFEYMAHRFIFHYSGPIWILRKLAYFSHGVHHDDPANPDRLVMPPFFSLLLGSIFYFLIFRPLLGLESADLFMAFFASSYLYYDFTHYATHHIPPRTAWGKFLKQNHMLHHFVTQEARWGVSNPIWDYVFGTLSGKTSKNKEAKPQTDLEITHGP